MNLILLKELKREIAVHDLIERTHECEIVWSKVSTVRFETKDDFCKFIITNTGSQYVLEIFKDGVNRLTLISGIYPTVEQLWNAIHFENVTRDNKRKQFVNRLITTGHYCPDKKWEFGDGGVVVGGTATIITNEKGEGGVVVGGRAIVIDWLVASGGVVVGGTAFVDHIERAGGVVVGGTGIVEVIYNVSALGGVKVNGTGFTNQIPPPILALGGVVVGGIGHVLTNILGVGGGVVVSGSTTGSNNELWFASIEIPQPEAGRIWHCDSDAGDIDLYPLEPDYTGAPEIDPINRRVYWMDRTNFDLHRSSTDGLVDEIIFTLPPFEIFNASFPQRGLEYDYTNDKLVCHTFNSITGLFRIYIMDGDGSNQASFAIPLNPGSNIVNDVGLYVDAGFLYVAMSVGSFPFTVGNVRKYSYPGLTLLDTYIVPEIHGLEIDRTNDVIYYFNDSDNPSEPSLHSTDLNFSVIVDYTHFVEIDGIGLDEVNQVVYVLNNVTIFENYIERMDYNGDNHKVLSLLDYNTYRTPGGIGMNLPVERLPSINAIYNPVPSGGVKCGGSAAIAQKNVTLLYMANSSSDNRIETLSETFVVNSIVTGQDSPDDIVIDLTNLRIYWTNLGDQKLMKADVFGGLVTEILTAGGLLHGLCVDPPNNRIYYCAEETGSVGQIRRCSLTGTGDTLLYQGNLPTLRVVLGSDGLLYFTEGTDGFGVVRRMTTSGGSVTILRNTGIDNLRGIAVDLDNDHIYLTRENATGQPKILRMDIDGGNLTTLSSSSTFSSPDDISLDLINGVMYIANPGADNIVRMNLDGSGITILTTDNKNRRGLCRVVEGS